MKDDVCEEDRHGNRYCYCNADFCNGSDVDADGNRIPPKDRGRARKRLMSVRAMESLTAWRDVA